MTSVPPWNAAEVLSTSLVAFSSATLSWAAFSLVTWPCAAGGAPLCRPSVCLDGRMMPPIGARTLPATPRFLIEDIRDVWVVLRSARKLDLSRKVGFPSRDAVGLPPNQLTRIERVSHAGAKGGGAPVSSIFEKASEDP